VDATPITSVPRVALGVVGVSWWCVGRRGLINVRALVQMSALRRVREHLKRDILKAWEISA
jgi:hypothetical protein